jgi:hypothetical protein
LSGILALRLLLCLLSSSGGESKIVIVVRILLCVLGVLLLLSVWRARRVLASGLLVLKGP